MPAKVYVVSSDGEASIPLPEKEFLGEKDKLKLRDEAIELQDLLQSVILTIGDSIQTESKLIIEISGSLKIGGSVEAGVPQILALNLFKIKGEGEKADALKLTLETTVKPDSSSD